MLTQHQLKRLLVLSTVEDVGFLLLGVASVSTLGTEGILFAAVSHALAKALLFACLAAPEAAGEFEGTPIGIGGAVPGERLRIPLRNAGHAGHTAAAGLPGQVAALRYGAEDKHQCCWRPWCWRRSSH